jgi:hypothetical protein
MSIFTARPGELIAQPGRSVQNFPGGLVRVDQTYLGETASRESHRAICAVANPMPDGNQDPSMEGLFIYPDVNEIEREDGFTEYRVSAYGRRNSDLSDLALTQIEQEYLYAGGNITFSVYEATGKITVPTGTVMTPAAINVSEEVRLPFNIQRIGWTTVSLTPGQNIILPPQFPPVGGVNQNSAIFVEADALPDRSFRRQYILELQSDVPGDPNIKLSIYIKDPIVKISGQQFYGKYVEYQIQMTREVETDPTVALVSVYEEP